MRGEQRRVFWNVRRLPDIGTRLEVKAKDKKTLKVSNFLRVFLFSHHFGKIVCEQLVLPDQTKLS